ncbi:hypothetical protein BLGI_3465 [Brevibacillus laterosporus GI-9]|nr:hypothetical protein BLGI_3465 [Brevibacillus laterosporus GI-9]
MKSAACLFSDMNENSVFWRKITCKIELFSPTFIINNYHIKRVGKSV